jgi:hypothetical protein
MGHLRCVNRLAIAMRAVPLNGGIELAMLRQKEDA